MIDKENPIIKKDIENIVLEKLNWKKLKNKTILITGGNGFLASYVIKSLLAANDYYNLNTKIICEGANGPISSQADKLLNQRNILIIPDLYANAGGVAVSYFEWVRNLSHMRFGRMEKRRKEYENASLINLIESTTGTRVPDRKKSLLSEGRSELDLVRSGLEDMMTEAYESMSYLWNKESYPNLRVTAYIYSIKKLIDSYKSIGI